LILVAALGLPPLAHHDDPTRGVQAALAAQAALEEVRAALVERENAARMAQVTLGYESGTLLSDFDIQD
jgi:hypothetical protein